MIVLIIVALVALLVDASIRAVVGTQAHYYWPAPIVVHRTGASPVGCALMVVILIVILVAALGGMEIVF